MSSSLKKKILPVLSLTFGVCAFVGVFHSDYIFSENDHRVNQVKRVALANSTTHTHQHHDDIRARNTLSVSEVLTPEDDDTADDATANVQLNWQDELTKRDIRIEEMQNTIRDMQKNIEVLQRKVSDLTAATPASPPASPKTGATSKPVATRPVVIKPVIPAGNLFPNKTLTYENYLRTTKFSAPPLPANHDNLDACLVHVGKTAGSTISCVVGNIQVPSCMPQSDKAKEFAQYRSHSKLAHLIARTGPTKNWRHLRSNRCELNPNKKHLVVTTTRDPITRLVSAFYFEQKRCIDHPTDSTNIGCTHIYDCYNDMESLAATGLKEAFQHNNQSLPPRAKDMTCPQKALGFVSGTRDYWRFNHHWYNYEFYLPFLLAPSNGDGNPFNNKPLWRTDQVEAIDIALKSRPTHRIVALRNEHLVQDWGSVESLLGGNVTTGKDLFENHLNPSSKAILTKEALTYLCDALCVDIQYYKLTLWWSSNLQAKDIEISMSTLRESCPEEPSHIRRCSNMPSAGRHKEEPYRQRGPQSVSLGVGKPRLKVLQ